MLDGAQYYATHVDTMQCKLPGKLMYRGAEDYATVAPDVTGHGCYFDLRDGVEPAPGYWGQYTTYIFRDRALDLVGRHRADEPMFLTLAFNAVHEPVWAPDDAYERYPELHNVTNGLRRRFSAALRLVDESVDALVQRLHDKKMYRDSVLVVVSDNGANPEHGGSNWPLRGSKGYLFEGGVRVPAFIHAPRYVPAGATYDGIFHISDWLPTLVEGFVGGNVAALGSTAKQLAAGDAALNGTWFGRAPAAAVAQLRQTALQSAQPQGGAQPQQARAAQPPRRALADAATVTACQPVCAKTCVTRAPA